MTYAFVNDSFVEANEATISIAERGFRFGDGVFETCRVSSGNMYRFSHHLARFEQGIKRIKLQADITQLQDQCMALIEKNEVTEGMLRFSVSRGIGSKGYLPTYETKPTLVIETLPLPHRPNAPINLWHSSQYSLSSTNYFTGIKTMQGLLYTLARMEATEHECFETLLLNDKDMVSEGSSSNIFWFNNGTLYTPDIACGIVGGIMRQTIMELSPYPVEEGHYSLQNILQAQQVFVTNIAWQCVPVACIFPHKVAYICHDVSAQLNHLINEDMIREAC